MEQSQQETTETATPPRSRRIWHRPSLATLMGGFGVLMGFATFVLVQDESHKTEKESLGIFITGLVAAALTSFVIESVRARVEEHGEHEPINVGRFLGLLILLGIFELFVTGADSLARFVFAGDQSLFVKGLFSVGTDTELPAYSDLSSGAEMCYFVGLWILLGCATGWAASRALPRSSGMSARRTLFIALMSILKGFVAVALLAFLYICIARLAGTAYVLMVDPSRYNPGYLRLLSSPASSGPLFGTISAIAVGLAAAVESIAHWGSLGILGVIAAVVAIAAALVVLAAHPDRMAKWGMLHTVLTYGFIGALLLIGLGPFATNGLQFRQLMHIVFACTLIWLAPLIVLIIAAPWLRAPSHNPRIWGLVALGVAGILFAVTWGRLTVSSERVVSYLAIALLAYTAVCFIRGASLREFWPFAALVVATATFELGAGLSQLSVLNTYKSFALLQSAKFEGDASHAPHAGYSAIADWRDRGSIDAGTADLVARVEALWNIVDQRDITQATSALSKAIADQRAIPIKAAIDELRGGSGSAWLDALHGEFETICDKETARLIAAPPTADPAPLPALRESSPRAGALLWPIMREIEALNSARSVPRVTSGMDEDAIARSLIAPPHPPASPSPSPSPYAAPALQPHLPDSSAITADADTEIDVLKKFRWLSPDSSAMTAVARLAREHLPDADRDLNATDTVALLQPSAHRGAEERGWLVLSIMARSAPPGLAAIAWEHNPRLHDKWQTRLLEGLSLDQIDDLWNWRLSDLASFGELASSASPASWGVTPNESGELVRQRHTLIALGFASAQLSMLANEAKRGGNFKLDQRSVRYLELTLGACFAFWATAGLLAVSAKQTHSAE